MVKKTCSLKIVFSVFVLILFIYLVIAATAGDAGKIVTPATGANLSGVATFNASFLNGTDISINAALNMTALNATFYYNTSGTWTAMGNSTTCGLDSVGNGTISCWGDINTSSLTDGFWSINVTFTNSSTNISIVNASNLTQHITIDNTPPIVNAANITTLIDGGNFSGNGTVLNLSISDATIGVADVYFNITNRTGKQNFSKIAVREGTTSRYSYIINTSAFPDGTYSFIVHTNDSLNNRNNSALLNISFDNTAPQVVAANISGRLAAGGNFSGNDFLLNVSVIDLTVSIGSVAVNFTNSSGTQNQSFTLTREAGQKSSFSAYINTSDIRDGNYTVFIYTNDSAGNDNNTAQLADVTIDNTAPSVSLSCTPDPVDEGNTITCTCSGADTTSDINSTTFTANPSTSGTGTHSTSCDVIDTAGNLASTTVEYTVSGAGGGGGGGGGGGAGAGADTAEDVKKTQIWSRISPGVESTMANLGPDYGVKEVIFSLTEESNNAKVTVKKHTSKPAEVVQKEGPVYRYLEITTQNVGDTLDKATVILQVGKIWVSDNNLGRDEVALFRFADNKWNQLPTTYIEEDADSYFYEAETSSFSFFTIGKIIPEPEEPEETEEPIPTTPTSEEPESSSGKTWLIVIIIIVIIAAVIGFVMKKKRG